MAWYTINRKCGCEATIYLFGAEGTHSEAISRLTNTACDKCAKKEASEKKHRHSQIKIKNKAISCGDMAAIRLFCESIEAETEMHVGVRFEDLLRKVGDVCDNSRHNSDRDDSRDFPEYTDDAYAAMEVLDGTSSWNWQKNLCGQYTQHCYIIASNEIGCHDDPDDGEILLKSPVIMAKLF